MAERKTLPFHLTKADIEGRTFEGYAAAFHNVDAVGDIIHPNAFAKTLVERGNKVKLLWQHDYAEPIGRPLELREDANGLFIKAVISDTARGRDALALLRDGAINEMSIGYEPISAGTDYTKMPDGQTVRNLREIKLHEVSLVTFPANERAVVTAVKSVLPFRATTKAPDDEAWSAPTLSDFTDKAWGDLSESEIGRIMACFAWTAHNPPTSYGDLKLPHHNPDGAVVWRGVANCMARLNQADIPEGDMAGIREHMAGHYRQFDREMPGDMMGKAEEPVREVKAGRVLSAANATRLRNALGELSEILSAAGLLEPATEDEEPKDKDSQTKGAGPGDAPPPARPDATPPTADERLARYREAALAELEMLEVEL